MSSAKAVIIDYGMGNVASVQKALNYLQIQNIISNSEREIKNAEYLILPGVGSYKQGMLNLKEYNLIDVLNEQVMVKTKPILGICLGMQLFSESGSEPEHSKGLGWIKGEVVKIPYVGHRLPHLGWNTVRFVSGEWSDFNGEDFYFIHGYHFRLENSEDVLANVHYGQELIAAVQKKNIVATQFHPEKSQKKGIELLKHFFSMYA
jgi:imidazole glycerol-phosphate synthase subunit HisH